jgi:hypothetical protein
MTGPGAELTTKEAPARACAAACALVLLCCLASAAPAAAKPWAPAKGKAFHGVSDTGDVADFHSFVQNVGAHPAVMQTFHFWGTFPSQAMMRWDLTDTRGMISIGTSKGYGEPEIISPQAIANGEGDSYPLNLNSAIAQWDQPVYLRLMAEMNGHWNAYSAYNADGTFRGPAHSPTAYRQAWRRFALIVRGGPVATINAQLIQLGMPPIQATVPEVLPVPKVALMWVPHSSPTPNIHANRWQVYWPGKKYVDWVGTDIFSTAPNWTNLTRLYEGYKHKPFVVGEYAPFGEDDPSYVKTLFRWSRSHKRSKMLVYYQGFENDPTFNIANFPAARGVLRGRLAGPRFVPFATGTTGNGAGGVAPTPSYAYGPRDQRVEAVEPPSP